MAMDAAGMLAGAMQDPNMMPGPSRGHAHSLTFNPDELAQIEPDYGPERHLTNEQREAIKAQRAAAAAAKAARAVERDQLVDDAAVSPGSYWCAAPDPVTICQPQVTVGWHKPCQGSAQCGGMLHVGRSVDMAANGLLRDKLPQCKGCIRAVHARRAASSPLFRQGCCAHEKCWD